MNPSPASEHAVIPPEAERLFNPAFCAFILAQYANAYHSAQASQTVKGVPYPLLFLCLPLALHVKTQEEINKHIRAYGLHRFVRGYPDLLIRLPERVNGFETITRDALLFGIYHNLLQFDVQEAAISEEEGALRRFSRASAGDEPMQALKAAERLGTWFGQLTIAEVFLHLALQP